MSEAAIGIILVAGAGIGAAVLWPHLKGKKIITTTTYPNAPAEPQQGQGGAGGPISFDWLSGALDGIAGLFGSDTTVQPSDSGSVAVSPPTTPQPPASNNAHGYSDEELTLARTIYGESARSPDKGKRAVASVILNRVRSPRWPSSISGVCLQPWQFSCWNHGDPMRARIEDMQPGHNNAFNRCLQIARQAVRGGLADVTGGATHYYATYIDEPRWIAASPNARMTAHIGLHKFYRGIA